MIADIRITKERRSTRVVVTAQTSAGLDLLQAKFGKVNVYYEVLLPKSRLQEARDLEHHAKVEDVYDLNTIRDRESDELVRGIAE